MAKLERETSAIRRRINMQKIVLQSIAGAGLLSVALLAPNAMQVLRLLHPDTTRRMHPKYLIASTFNKLCDKRLIVVESTSRGSMIRLTNEGKLALARMVARSPDTRKHKRWDKRWRMVVYDIKEKRRAVRGKLRDTLSTFGFYKLQASTWVYPYECEELIILLKADFKIGIEVLYVIVEKIENDQKLKDHFGLK